MKPSPRHMLTMLAIVLSGALIACGGSTAQPNRSVQTTAGLDPHPLSQRQTVVYASPGLITAAAPLFAADFLGEFNRENIDIKVEPVAAPNHVLVVAQGKADVTLSGIQAGVLNQIASGSVLRAIVPLQVPGPGSHEGIWVRKSLLGNDGKLHASALRGQTIYNTAGPPASIYWVVDAVNALNPGEPKLGISDIKSGIFSPADTPTAMKNGSISAAIVLSPFWRQLEGESCCVFAAPYPPEPLGFWIAGPTLIKERPDVGQAFVRAMLRTIRDNFQGNWTANASLVSQLAKVLKTPESALSSMPATNFGPGDPTAELKFWNNEVAAKVQDEYFQRGKDLGQPILSYQKPIPDKDVYYKNFIEALVK